MGAIQGPTGRCGQPSPATQQPAVLCARNAQRDRPGRAAERQRPAETAAPGKAARRAIEGAARVLPSQPAARLLGRAARPSSAAAAAADDRSTARAAGTGHRPGPGCGLLGPRTAKGGVLVPSAAGRRVGAGQPRAEILASAVQRARHDPRVRRADFATHLDGRGCGLGVAGSTRRSRAARRIREVTRGPDRPGPVAPADDRLPNPQDPRRASRGGSGDARQENHPAPGDCAGEALC